MALKKRPVVSRPVMDKVMLGAVMICVAIAVLRLGLVVATVPYAAYVNHREAAKAVAAGKPAPSVTITERVAGSRPFVSWWGGRDVPERAGGDYLAEVSHHSAARTLGCVIGVIAEKEHVKGVVMARVIVPSDKVALYGEQSGTLFTRADGTTYRSYWAPLANDSAYFSDIPVVVSDYAPALTPSQVASVTADAGLTERSKDVYVGAPSFGGSGTWVLRVIAGATRRFLLLPIESSPIGGAL